MATKAFTGRASGDARPSLGIVEQGVYVTQHALQRLRLHHPSAGVRGALALLSRAEEVAPRLIAPFLGRGPDAVRDRYFVSACRRGVFVVARGRREGGFPWVLVTYLRFGPHQQLVAERLLGVTSSPRPSWSVDLHRCVPSPAVALRSTPRRPS